MQLTTVPITPDRTKSYNHNPNGKPDDIVLYLGFIDSKLIAFRTIFAGAANTENEQIRFGWCSGSWVATDFRREGFSKVLLKEAYKDWNSKLMLTNYAPNSEKLFLKTGWFNPIHKYNGVRAYLFPKTRKLIAGTNKNEILRILFSFVDVLILIFSSFQLLFYRTKTAPNIRFETLNFPDEECYSFNQENNLKLLFNRDEKELKWIFKFPWITQSDESYKNRYPFSAFSKSFTYKTVKIFIQNNFKGYFIFSVRNSHLKTLYFNTSPDLEKVIVNYLKYFCKKHKVEYVTIYNSKVADQLFVRKFPFLYLKRYGQKIYSTFELKNNNEYQLQDGDGDVIFT